MIHDEVQHLCVLAAELADELAAEKIDHFKVQLKATVVELDGPVLEPVTLTYEAEWMGGEWKRTKRTRLEELA